ncbi:MAG: SpoVG family protein [Candidatus Omnitrophica bacterium]|nr:SpoVG family protein [Candidatus Omnitrophota bacterium]MBU2044748.1 SpoVG family protein [Candidatus Omnitrophota bacterium]MBU2250886.1 SpoVG family protein [Candidatus Omnitrophota bacterium]MBU2473802.1 SpoVG family protein [Candidatus Omnitrophota bacterium]
MVLEFKVARLHKLEGDGPTKAFCDLAISDEFLVKGFRVVEGKNGLFVGLPRQATKNGKWFDQVLPLTDAARESINEAVLAAYEDSNNQ